MFGLTTSGGGSCTAFPNVCQTPVPGAPPVPIPYPSLAQCSQAKGSTCSKRVKISNKATHTKKTVISRSNGDEAGINKGLISRSNMKQVVRKMGVSKIKVEGAPVVTVMKPTAHNGSNANAPAGMQAAPSQSKVTCLG